MSGWTQYKPKLALYDILDKPGGISVDQAMQRADAALEQHRAGATAALRDAMNKLEELARSRDIARAGECYELSIFVLDIAGIFQPPLCRAANSLCELVLRMKAAGKWDWPSIDVHVSTMKLLADKRDESDPAVQTVLKGLGSVVSRFPDPSPPDPPKIKV